MIKDMIEIQNRFNIGDSIVYLHEGKLNKGKILSVTSTVSADKTYFSYILEDYNVASEPYIYSTLKEALISLLENIDV